MMASPARVAPHLRIEQDLAGKVGIVTGASKGIGRAIVLNLTSRGCSILATCSSSKTLSDIDQLQKEAISLYQDNKYGLQAPKVVGAAANVTSSDFATIIADAIAEHFDSKVNIFVNSATYLGATDIGNIKAEDIQNHLMGGVQTPILTVEELARRKMFQKESRLVYISSLAARTNPGFNLLYNVAKSAGESLSRTWANLYGGAEEQFAFMAGTTSNSVSVGLTETQAVTKFGPEFFQKLQDDAVPQQTLRRLGQPEDVADVVGMLCSPDARWITGSVVAADGGAAFIT